MLPNPNRQLPENVPLKKSSWMKSNLPAVNILTLISAHSEIGNEVLTVEGLSKTIDGVKVLDNVSFILGHDDKVAFVGSNELAKTTLFKILAGEMEPDEGTYKWGLRLPVLFSEGQYRNL